MINKVWYVCGLVVFSLSHFITKNWILIYGFENFMSLFRRFFIVTLIVFLLVMTLCIRHPICCQYPRPALTILPRVLLALLDFLISPTLAFLLIHDNIQWSNVVVCLNWIWTQLPFCFARPCVMWSSFTSSHHNINPFTFHYFFSFDLIKMNVCHTYDVVLLSSVHMPYSWAFLRWDNF